MKRERTFPIGACCAWLASAAPFLLPESALLGASRAALAALPWIAFTSLPRRPSDTARQELPPHESALHESALCESALGDRALELALFLPTLALGSWIDLAQGRSRADVALVAGASVVVCALFACAAQLAASTSRARVVHAVAWFAFVAVPPLWSASLAWGGAPAFGPAPRWLELLSRASPLTWGMRALDADAPVPWPWAAIVSACVLAGLGFVARERTPIEVDS